MAVECANKCTGEHRFFVAERVVVQRNDSTYLLIFTACTACGLDKKFEYDLGGLPLASTESDLIGSANTIN